MSGRNAVFAASRQVAELIEEPEFISDDEGQRWEAEALLGPWSERYPILVKFLPICPGIAFPYHKGDIVEVVQAQADALVVGVYDAGAIDHEGHTVLGPRTDTDKDLRLGPIEGGEWEPVALHARAHESILALKARVDYLANQVATVLNALDVPPKPFPSTPPGPGDLWHEGYESQGSVPGVDPASRVKGRKAS